ncbi:hypothetical protein OG943_39750 [Amycolatopsis sp. NBC_00345]|uniref:hypothetical protein n=1 Tax=Amycolatopsis sp. NBC_00345 TaxID=2975955 RepID=UPI002E26D4E1
MCDGPVPTFSTFRCRQYGQFCGIVPPVVFQRVASTTVTRSLLTLGGASVAG